MMEFEVKGEFECHRRFVLIPKIMEIGMAVVIPGKPGYSIIVHGIADGFIEYEYKNVMETIKK